MGLRSHERIRQEQNQAGLELVGLRHGLSVPGHGLHRGKLLGDGCDRGPRLVCYFESGTGLGQEWERSPKTEAH